MTSKLKKIFDPDLMGTIASVICLIHCLLMPWVLMISGAWLSQYVTHPYFHHVMLFAALGIGIPVFVRSYLKYNSKAILTLGCLGLSITAYGTLQEDSCATRCALAHLQASSAKAEKAELTDKTEESCGGCASESSGEELSSCAISSDNAKLSDASSETENSMSAYSVPFGVLLILVAHVLNFRHKHSCKKKCCPSH